MVSVMSSPHDKADADKIRHAQLEQLLMAAKDGDEKALNTLLTEMRRELRSRAHGKLPSEVRVREDTSDLLQDTLMESLQYLARFRGSSIEEWRVSLVRILRNNTKDTLRAQLRAFCRAAWAERSLDDPNNSPGLMQQLVSPDTSPSQEVAKNEELALLHAAIPKLPEQQRKAINLWLLNYTFQEIAEELEVTEAAAQSLVRHAKEALRAMLGGTEGPS